MKLILKSKVMENIKFRSAHYNYSDNKFSHFSYWGRIDHKGNFSTDVFTSPSNSSSTYIKNDDQFTGNYDKNGSEIYENDKLKRLKDEYIEEYFGVVRFYGSEFTTIDYSTVFNQNVDTDINDCILGYKEGFIELAGNIHKE